MDLNTLKKANVVTPSYDREQMITDTTEHPIWIHFGTGNIFRGYIAALQDSLLEKGIESKGIITVETFDEEIIDKVLKPCGNICVGVTLKADGSYENNAICSVADSLKLSDYERLCAYFEDPELQMVTLTVTEKGYRVKNEDGSIIPNIFADIMEGPKAVSNNLMVILAALCYRRFTAGANPIAVVSMDNCSANGKKLRDSVLTVASEWLRLGMVQKEFISYLSDETSVSFPWSMIDRITPAPSEKINEYLKNLGINSYILRTSKNSVAASFVNMEECCYLVIEDSFPNKRPKLEMAGVIFTDRETVEKCESMKVYTCLNPLHTALAVLGCVLGFTSISDEMADRELNKFVNLLAYKEMLPVAVNPEVLSPESFLNDVLNERLPNVNIPDTPQRIATDTSQKIPIRFGNAITAHMLNGNADKLKYIPFAIAAWCRYLVAKDDKGNKFTLSPDPCAEELTAVFSVLEFGITRQEALNAINKIITPLYMGCNIEKTDIPEKISEYFYKMMKGQNAVRDTLKEFAELA